MSEQRREAAIGTLEEVAAGGDVSLRPQRFRIDGLCGGKRTRPVAFRRLLEAVFQVELRKRKPRFELRDFERHAVQTAVRPACAVNRVHAFRKHLRTQRRVRGLIEYSGRGNERRLVSTIYFTRPGVVPKLPTATNLLSIQTEALVGRRLKDGTEEEIVRVIGCCELSGRLISGPPETIGFHLAGRQGLEPR